MLHLFLSCLLKYPRMYTLHFHIFYIWTSRFLLIFGLICLLILHSFPQVYLQCKIPESIGNVTSAEINDFCWTKPLVASIEDENGMIHIVDAFIYPNVGLALFASVLILYIPTWLDCITTSRLLIAILTELHQLGPNPLDDNKFWIIQQSASHYVDSFDGRSALYFLDVALIEFICSLATLLNYFLFWCIFGNVWIRHLQTLYSSSQTIKTFHSKGWCVLEPEIKADCQFRFNVALWYFSTLYNLCNLLFIPSFFQLNLCRCASYITVVRRKMLKYLTFIPNFKMNPKIDEAFALQVDRFDYTDLHLLAQFRANLNVQKFTCFILLVGVMMGIFKIEDVKPILNRFRTNQRTRF